MINPLRELESYRNLLDALKTRKTPALATGVIDSQKVHLAYALMCDTSCPSLIIAQSENHAKQIYEDMRFFFRNTVRYYPAKDIIFYNADVHSIDITKQRLGVLDALIDNGTEISSIVLSVEALADKLTPKAAYIANVLKLEIGADIYQKEFIKNLVYMGYERTELVEGTGQFAVRGGIIDIYTATYDYPVRVELWDDSVYSMRLIDAVSQRSVENIDELRIAPVCELLPAFADDGSATLFDYLSADTIVFFDEPQRIALQMENLEEEYKQSIHNRIQNSDEDAKPDTVFSYAQILEAATRFNIVLFTTLTHMVRDFTVKNVFSFSVKSQGATKLRADLLMDDLKYYTQNNFRTVILAGSGMRARNLIEEIRNNGISARYIEDIRDEGLAELSKGIVCVSGGSLSKGFEYQLINFAVLSDKELFGEAKRKKSRRKKKGTRIESFTDLNVGDYIVHDSHGIGIYMGIEHIFVDGVTKDYLKLQYSDGGNLYVHTSQMDMVQKYIGGEGAGVKLNKLGGDSWSKAKAKAKKAVAELAQELIELYAKRQSAQGYVYSADTVWQREFEDSFQYEETEDQLAAIADVKSDMESPKVMDRLICGDVGYGKTEIAIRAAFKAAQESKQVVFLVPTTILAQQHYNTLTQRMKDYPIKIEMLSRFRTSKQQKDTLEKTEAGITDILVGTHRVLSKDIKFKDLGLIVVDEEQRFGVTHKEKLKKLREHVDVLTLTATPIPRTLHMSLTGIRDLSLLEEPPQERKPVQTYVMEYNAEFIKDAINRELSRGGQVYYLHNRVMSIRETAARIARLVPEASIAYAHGQMSERELENIMLDFIEGDVNVLVCTTIIETGLDIANVNTIIIEDSDRMGLAQLYQLRGRVGRSNRLAYAYLCYRKDKVLEDVAEKRLQTIREFTEFGSGIKIAMRDLEIRGAGNLLGVSQHGHMDAVGYEMYCKLLNEALRGLKGEVVQEGFETAIDINIDAYIPSDYIEDEEQKLEIYKKIAGITSEEDYFDVQEEIEDRYGNIRKSVQNLLNIASLKAYAHNIGIVSVQQRAGNIVMQFKPDANVDLDKMTGIITKNDMLKFAVKHNPVMTYAIGSGDLNKKIVELMHLLKKMA